MSTPLTEKRAGWRFALPVSVLLNLFLIAVIGGHLLRHYRNDAGAGSGSLPRVLANIQASLSPADAAAFAAVMKRDAPRYLGAARKVGEARAALERQLTAQPYDEVATKQAFTTWQDSANRLLSDIRDPLIEALDQVSPEGRQKLVANRRKTQPAWYIR